MMKEIIVITGTPGTGKTSLCKYIVKNNRGWVHLDLGRFAIKVGAIIDYNGSMRSRIVDINFLKKALRKYISDKAEEGVKVLIDGHYAAEVSPASYVDCCIVLRCRPDILWHRLRKVRRYNREKIRRNIESELTDYCYLIAKRSLRNVKIIQLDTSRESIRTLYYRFMKCYRKNFECESDRVDWIDYFFKHPGKIKIFS
jgi:adenylate kinase